MIATKDLVALLAERVRLTVTEQGQPVLQEVLSLGRKMKEGQVQLIDTETYAGPDAGRAPYGYIRFRDGSKEHAFSAVKGFTGDPHVEVRALLRFVAVHRCTNESALQSGIIAALLLAGARSSNLYAITLVGSSARGQTVNAEETNEGVDFQGEARLLAVDFDLTYILSADEAACNIVCNACC